jgi:hypothetical protein
VNVLDGKGSIVGSTTTNGAGAYSLGGLPSGTYMVQAVSATGAVMSTSLATLGTSTPKSTANLTASAAPAQGGQASAVASGAMNTKTLWWMIGASAATAGLAATVAMQDPASPAQ